jgi:hypothetical protein
VELILVFLAFEIAPRSIRNGSLEGWVCRTHLGEGFSPSSPVDDKALSAEQACIDRPCSRAQHRHTDGHDREKDVNQCRLAMGIMEREQFPRLLQSNQRSHDRRPQATEQEDSACGSNQVLCEADLFDRLRRKICDPEADQSDSEATSE